MDDQGELRELLKFAATVACKEGDLKEEEKHKYFMAGKLKP